MAKWSIIRLIWLRELRDQFRDRRTMFMVVVLPLVLYPFLGLKVLPYALLQGEKASVIGMRGMCHLPAARPAVGGGPAAVAGWLAMSSTVPLPGAAVERVVAAVALTQAALLNQDFPPLLVEDAAGRHFSGRWFESANQASLVQVRDVADDDGKELLAAKDIDLLVSVPEDFVARMEQGGRPCLTLEYRDDDAVSELAWQRFRGVFANWKSALKDTRLGRLGVPPGYDDPVEARSPKKATAGLERKTRDLDHLLIRIFPFMVVMWAMAGAMYPAIDIGAGEKERGTLETLLISPAGRHEIAWGKFLTIWVISCSTTIWNLVGLSVTTWVLTWPLPRFVPSPVAFAWSVVAVLPLAALFSAVCLAIGVFARSTKEGQYYLMPLFLVTLPLVFLGLAPDVTLTPLTSLVPVTGMALLMQQVMLATSLAQVPWLYFPPVLAVLALSSWLALLWATWLFQRETVLFREAERFWDVRALFPAWLRGSPDEKD